MSYWLRKTFPNCRVKCISALNETSESIKLPETRTNAHNNCFKDLQVALNIDKVNKAINYAFIPNFQILCPNLQILHLYVQFITQAGKSHWQGL